MTDEKRNPLLDISQGNEETESNNLEPDKTAETTASTEKSVEQAEEKPDLGKFRTPEDRAKGYEELERDYHKRNRLLNAALNDWQIDGRPMTPEEYYHFSNDAMRKSFASEKETEQAKEEEDVIDPDIKKHLDKLENQNRKLSAQLRTIEDQGRARDYETAMNIVDNEIAAIKALGFDEDQALIFINGVKDGHSPIEAAKKFAVSLEAKSEKRKQEYIKGKRLTQTIGKETGGVPPLSEGLTISFKKGEGRITPMEALKKRMMGEK